MIPSVYIGFCICIGTVDGYFAREEKFHYDIRGNGSFTRPEKTLTAASIHRNSTIRRKLFFKKKKK